MLTVRRGGKGQGPGAPSDGITRPVGAAEGVDGRLALLHRR